MKTVKDGTFIDDPALQRNKAFTNLPKTKRKGNDKIMTLTMEKTLYKTDKYQKN